jgi:hypothetical protein
MSDKNKNTVLIGITENFLRKKIAVFVYTEENLSGA